MRGLRDLLLAFCVAFLAPPVGGHGLPAPAVARNGTGFVVDTAGRVVTSHHIVKGCRGLVLTRGDVRVGASLLSADGGADLALLVPRGALPASPVSFRPEPEARVGERVIVAGFPREVNAVGWLRAGAAKVVAATDQAGRFRVSVPVEPGNSGGPVLDVSGRVIGVAAGTLRYRSTGAPAGNPGVAIGGARLKAFLRRAGVDYRLGDRATLGISAIADRTRHSTVLVECF